MYVYTIISTTCTYLGTCSRNRDILLPNVVLGDTAVLTWKYSNAIGRSLNYA